MNDVTIVTSFVDIGRESWEGVVNGKPIPNFIKRDTNTYLKRFERLTKLKNDIIVFTQTKFFDQIKSMRSDIRLVDIDLVWEVHETLLSRIRTTQQRKEFVNFVLNPSSPEYWSPEYVAINFFKSFIVDACIEQKWVKTENAAWIDFGYCRDDVYCPPNKTWKFDTQSKINLFANRPDLFDRPIFDIVRTGDVYFQGCHVVGPVALWSELKRLIEFHLVSLLSCDLIDDDQTLLLMSYRASPNIFKIIKSDPNNWFTVFEGRCFD